MHDPKCKNAIIDRTLYPKLCRLSGNKIFYHFKKSMMHSHTQKLKGHEFINRIKVIFPSFYLIQDLMVQTDSHTYHSFLKNNCIAMLYT
jgi:hypothetical protein